MNSNQTYYGSTPVGRLDAQTRGAFVSRTYSHLFSAIAAFTVLEIFFFKTGLAESIAKVLLSGSWLLVLGGFMVISWIARGVAHSSTSKAAQYDALAGYVVGDQRQRGERVRQRHQYAGAQLSGRSRRCLLRSEVRPDRAEWELSL